MSTYLRDLANSVLTKSASDPAARTATVTGSGVDMITADGRCFAIQHVAAVTGTTPTLDGKIQESSDNSTFTDVSGATFTQVTTSTNLQVITFDRTKRYVRYVGTIAGTTPSFTMGVLVGEQLKQL